MSEMPGSPEKNIFEKIPRSREVAVLGMIGAALGGSALFGSLASESNADSALKNPQGRLSPKDFHTGPTPIPVEGFRYSKSPSETSHIEDVTVTVDKIKVSLISKKQHGPSKHRPTGCTSIRDEAFGRYIGLACKSSGDKSFLLDNTPGLLRPYSVFRTTEERKFVYKCGYGEDTLPRLKTVKMPKKVIAYCNLAESKLKDRDAYFKDHNCELIKNTRRDACDDGTAATPIADDCQGATRRLYANFTTRRKSILNASGAKVKHPFSKVRSLNDKVSNIHYRFRIKQAGQFGNKKVKAAVVRTDDIDGKLGWGFMRGQCPKENLEGGPERAKP